MAVIVKFDEGHREMRTDTYFSIYACCWSRRHDGAACLRGHHGGHQRGETVEFIYVEEAEAGHI